MAIEGVVAKPVRETGNRTGTISIAKVAQAGPMLTFADRYPANDIFAPTVVPKTTSAPVQAAAPVPSQPSQPSYRFASLSPDVPYVPAVKQATHTDLIGFENSAFPYDGRSSRPGGRYSDNRVLVHVPRGFNANKPGVIVVFFHGHGATLERDVRNRQLLPAQISEAGTNAVLVAPQLAYDAADSSAGKFYEPGGLKRFLAEAAVHLARVYGDPGAAAAFARMPVVLVGYSGGFVSTAFSLSVGGAGNRIIGVVLLDALYGHMDKFASWITNNRSAFFVSSYTRYTKRHDDELERMLRDKSIAITHELNGPLKPGTVAFIETPEAVRHRDYVTLAWTEHPIKDVLERMAQR